MQLYSVEIKRNGQWMPFGHYVSETAIRKIVDRYSLTRSEGYRVSRTTQEEADSFFNDLDSPQGL